MRKQTKTVLQFLFFKFAELVSELTVQLAVYMAAQPAPTTVKLIRSGLYLGSLFEAFTI